MWEFMDISCFMYFLGSRLETEDLFQILLLEEGRGWLGSFKKSFFNFEFCLQANPIYDIKKATKKNLRSQGNFLRVPQAL